MYTIEKLESHTNFPKKLVTIDDIIEELNTLLNKNNADLTEEEVARAIKLIRFVDSNGELRTARNKAKKEVDKRKMILENYLDERTSDNTINNINRMISTYQPILGNEYRTFFKECSDYVWAYEVLEDEVKDLYDKQRNPEVWQEPSIFEYDETVYGVFLLAVLSPVICFAIMCIVSMATSFIPVISNIVSLLTIPISFLSAIVAPTSFVLARTNKKRKREQTRMSHIDKRIAWDEKCRKVENDLNSLSYELKKRLTDFYSDPKVKNLFEANVQEARNNQKSIEDEINRLEKELFPEITIVGLHFVPCKYYEEIHAKKDKLIKMLEQSGDDPSSIGATDDMSNAINPELFTKDEEGKTKSIGTIFN